MAFIRFTGCSVGKKICQHCDTDFDITYPWLGGGGYSEEELAEWVGFTEHVCFTGGEPLDRELGPLTGALWRGAPKVKIHIETSGTIPLPAWALHSQVHVCVSPKPGFLLSAIDEADEIKVIVPGLGINPPPNTRWPDLSDALVWAAEGKTVFLQPRNAKYDVDHLQLALCEKLVNENPSLRLSVQMHKILRVR
jgi:organic radical activating enzyme